MALDSISIRQARVWSACWWWTAGWGLGDPHDHPEHVGGS